MAWIAVHTDRQRRTIRELALVLEALGIPNDVAPVAGSFELRVPEPQVASALEQLQAYAQENRNWPPADDEPGPWSQGAAACVVYAAVISAVHQVATFDPGRWQLPWTEAGVLRSDLVQTGEWWRCATALTLHADLPHLMGNLLFGALFGALASQLVGTGLAWCAILGAGVCGNFANAWLQQPSHAAVGASTAVFGAVGLIAAYRWRRRASFQHGPLSRGAPLFVGVALLGLLGTGGERVDVVAHGTGFAAGVLAGIVIAAWRHRRELPGPRAQAGLGLLPPALIACAWWWALS